MSAIITTNIDGAFPVAGQDNNSQGFRDNFTNIKTALTVAKSEITTLETNTAKLNLDNDFNGKIIENAELSKVYQSVRNNGTVPIGAESFTNIDLENGALQTFTLKQNHVLVFSNWPTGDLYAKVRVHLASDQNGNWDVTFGGTATIKKAGDSGTFPSPFTLASSGAEKVIEAWSYDGGTTIYIKYLGQFV